MKRIVTLLCLALATLSLAAQKIIKPGVKTPTTFAIVIDQTSYEKTREAVEAYKESIENDGLGTWVLIDDWKSPEAIKKLLQKYHADKKSPLEGCVFVGDIPIPMVRDGQYLTSAFKMNQKRDWKESSVASDRFYDDFSLKFDFLKQDADIPLYFYYSLRPDSKHYLSPDIYSGRIKPLELEGVDKYKLLYDYLKKVAREKRENSGNVLDKLTMARGHGYNSEDRVAWAGEQLALREQMPQLFRPGNTIKFIDFDTMYPAKKIYLNEIQDDQLDVLLFHHHGAPDTQYLNGYPNVSNIDPSIENVKVFLRSKIPAKAKKVGREKAIDEYVKNYNVPRSWCEEAFDKSLQWKDSVNNEMMDIHTYDIRKLHPNARFVLFDACYNGSFYEKDNIAGSYIFADGKTIATIGGTVNALQDKWPDEFVGLLSAGMRIGQFNRMTGYLESHLIGDPTFRFTDNSKIGFDINQALALHHADAAFWRDKLNHQMPDVQAMALRQLHYAHDASMPRLLNDTYFASDNFVVRMEAVRLLGLYYPDQAIDVLKAAFNDSYELVRRLGSEMAERNASPAFIPCLVTATIQRGHENRLGFRLLNALGAFDCKELSAEMDRQLEGRYLYSDTLITKFRRMVKSNERHFVEDRKELADDSLKINTRCNTILAYRNHPQPQMVDDFVRIAADDKADKLMRIAALQTLGWYDTSYRRHDIVKALSNIRTTDADLQADITRTINRLKER